jgi:prolyl-tRNA editing enzyme YbaK/EbsC (Cys-tRNA(Pro) deacylase)
MSKSLTRVKRHLADLGLDIDILHVTVPTNTAQQAADVVGCQVDQIAKSVIFRAEDSGQAVLFLTPGGNRVDIAAASALAGTALGKADAALIRAQTGFAIGGVSPFGHLQPIRAFMDPRLAEFSEIWAAAGTPHHMFSIAPDVLIAKTGATVAAFTVGG